MAPNPRVAKAFHAMRNIGIPEEKTKPILKNLLKIYEKNWELIEEENYRALADAIFDSEEAQAAEQKKKHDNAEAEEKEKKLEQAEQMKAIEEEETLIQEEPERPFKRLRSRHHDAQASVSSINPSTNSSGTLLKRPKLEVDELPEVQPNLKSHLEPVITEPDTSNDSQHVSPLKRVRNKGKQPILPNDLARVAESDVSQSGGVDRTHPVVTDTTDSDSDILPRRLMDKGKEPLSQHSAPQEKRSVSDKPSPVCFKEPKVEPGIDVKPKHKTIALIKPKGEPLTDESPRFEVPVAMFMPESSTNGDASTESNMVREPNCLLPLTSNEASCELIDIPEKSTATLDIASSSSGKIKISLSCNSAHGKPELSVRSVDTVLKTMEAKFGESYKVLDPNFSVKKFMEDICEGLSNLESDFTGEPPVDVDCIPPKDPLETYAVDGECMRSNINGSVSTKGGTNVSLPHSQKLSPPSYDAVNTLQPVIDSTGNNCVKQVGQNGSENMESFDDVNDIAKGQENMIISLVNDVNSEYPPSFHYIPRNAVFQSAYVNFSLARIEDDNCCPTCFGDCLTSSTPCPCALQSGGGFAYTTEGLVNEELIDEVINMNRDPQKHCVVYCKVCPLERLKNEEIVQPCKGHSVRSFIKECWLKCGCNKKCGNRVVQCGIKHKLQVFMSSEGKGWGLRTLEDLPKGAFICEYVGEVLTNSELYNRVSQSMDKDDYAHPVLLDADWSAESELKDEETLCLDATYYGNVARFINHRCFDANLVEIPVEVENPDRHYYHLAFFTTRKVKALEELTRDYGIDFDDHPVKAFQCRCGSHFCRDVIRKTL